METTGQFGQALSLAKQRINQGNLFGAMTALNWAAQWLQDNGGPYVNRHGIVHHRRAMVEGEMGNIDDARSRFKRSDTEIGDDAPVERAKMLRDWSKFELLQGDEALARTKIHEAVHLLEEIEIGTPELDMEITITRGFLARVDIGRDRIGSQHTLRATAAALQGSEPEYELDPIDCLVGSLPAGLERQRYLLRAVYLSLQLGNKSRAIEYHAMLLGGNPLRRLLKLTQ